MEQTATAEDPTASPKVPNGSIVESDARGDENAPQEHGSSDPTYDVVDHVVDSRYKAVDQVDIRESKDEFASASDRALELLRNLPPCIDKRAKHRHWLRVLITPIAVIIALGIAAITWKTFFAPRQFATDQASIFPDEQARLGRAPTNSQIASTSGLAPPNMQNVPVIQERSRTANEENQRGPKDVVQNTFQKAALAGDANAQFQLGSAYAWGHGVPMDRVIGYTWLTLAFVNGKQEAEHSIRQITPQLGPGEIAQIRWNLGEMYANGVGVRTDKVTAYMWHVLAESAGGKRSTIAKSRLAGSMTPDERSEANSRALAWLHKHSR